MPEELLAVVVCSERRRGNLAGRNSRSGSRSLLRFGSESPNVFFNQSNIAVV